MISARDLELPGCRLFESSDIEDTRLRIAAVMQPHRLQPLGVVRDLQAYMDFVDLAGLGLGCIKFGNMRVSANHVEDYHLIILCRRGTALVQTDAGAIALDQHHGVCLAPGAPLNMEFSADCEQFVVRIGDGLFNRHTEMSSPSMRPGIDLCRPDLQAWARVLWSMTGCLGLVRQHPKVAIEYQRLFLGLLLQSLAHETHDTPAIAPHSVKRAEAFIHANAARAIYLDDIARASEVPARTLLGSFRRFRQTTPMSYLREVRLERVRNRLMDRSRTESITAVALEEGFQHLGRFAQQYAARFGEKPSETLRLARRQPARASHLLNGGS